MGFQTAYSKKLRLNRELARDFVSIRQYLDQIPEIKNMPNEQLLELVANKAYQYSMKCGIVKKLRDLCENNRVNGAIVTVRISPENWMDMVQTVGLAKRWNRMDEWDLFEDSLRVYIGEIKNRRCLP